MSLVAKGQPTNTKKNNPLFVKEKIAFSNFNSGNSNLFRLAIYKGHPYLLIYLWMSKSNQ